MKDIDITKKIKQLHDDSVVLKMMAEVKKELANGVSHDLQQEVSKLIGQAEKTDKSNVVTLMTRAPVKALYTLGETELLAASGKSLADWFSQPINFVGAGFILDIRRVIGTDDEVDVYLSPNSLDEGVISTALDGYKGKTITIAILNDDEQLLEASIYIDEDGSVAEGSGKLKERKSGTDVKGKISISIMVEGDLDIE
jgi:hypothetical protein